MISECQVRKVCIQFKRAHGTDNVYSVLHVIYSLTLKAFYKRNKMRLQQLLLLLSIIGHSRLPKSVTFKMRLGAQPFLWKWVLIAWEWKIISISKAEHLTSFWYRGPWGNSEMVYCHMIWSLLYRCIKDQCRLQFSSQCSCDSLTSEHFTMLLRQFLSIYIFLVSTTYVRNKVFDLQTVLWLTL